MACPYGVMGPPLLAGRKAGLRLSPQGYWQRLRHPQRRAQLVPIQAWIRDPSPESTHPYASSLRRNASATSLSVPTFLTSFPGSSARITPFLPIPLFRSDSAHQILAWPTLCPYRLSIQDCRCRYGRQPDSPLISAFPPRYPNRIPPPAAFLCPQPPFLQRRIACRKDGPPFPHAKRGGNGQPAHIPPSEQKTLFLHVDKEKQKSFGKASLFRPCRLTSFGEPHIFAL